MFKRHPRISTDLFLTLSPLLELSARRTLTSVKSRPSSSALTDVLTHSHGAMATSYGCTSEYSDTLSS